MDASKPSERARRRWYAGAALVVGAAVVLLLITVPSGGGVSATRMQQLINASYSTSGTRCVASTHGRDTCQIAAEKCHGTLVVAPVGSSTFTIVDAKPEQLDSAACDRGEGIEGEAE